MPYESHWVTSNRLALNRSWLYAEFVEILDSPLINDVPPEPARKPMIFFEPSEVTIPVAF